MKFKIKANNPPWPNQGHLVDQLRGLGWGVYDLYSLTYIVLYDPTFNSEKYGASASIIITKYSGTVLSLNCRDYSEFNEHYPIPEMPVEYPFWKYFKRLKVIFREGWNLATVLKHSDELLSIIKRINDYSREVV